MHHAKTCPAAPTVVDPRPARAGWAPGTYWCRCYSCRGDFVGDKRSITCATCAYLPTADEALLFIRDHIPLDDVREFAKRFERKQWEILSVRWNFPAILRGGSPL